jgi:hypothetical protein
MKVMYSVPSILAALAAGVFAYGCSGEKADPKTAGKSDLNPPGLLETVTRDSKIELRWSAGNVEEDFKGYYVFAMKKSDYDTKAKGKAKFPASADPTKAGIPRCQDNSAWFEAFGLPASTAECKADEATPATGSKLTDDDTALTDNTSSSSDKPEKLTGFVLCDETVAKGGKEPSLAVTSPAISTQKCTVSKLADGKTALENGVSYVFFVVAVAEDDLSVVSWTSNLVSDTPSKDSPVETSITLKTAEYVTITVDTTTKTATLKTQASSCTPASTACNKLSDLNTDNPTTPTIFISRTSATTEASFPQRLFISTAQGKAVQLQPRGPQTYDPLTGTKVARIPGDQAAAATSYPAAGTKYIVYNNQVFDFAVTEGTNVYYGKVVIGDVTYASSTVSTSDATLKVSVIFQPTANVRDYFVDPSAD